MNDPLIIDVAGAEVRWGRCAECSAFTVIVDSGWRTVNDTRRREDRRVETIFYCQPCSATNGTNALK